ncbi:S8 family peptidase [Phytomonospora sp. NPDC050363]|uniref:S8 family peptidase n=1 Tax=Phytomonospora sp. NPDC050363 TaxID=3155642 RepID=UPI0033C00023
MPFHPSLLLAGAGALLLSGAAIPAAGQPGAAAPAAFTAEELAQAREVTLITGDTVVVTADGEVGFLAGPGRGHVPHVKYYSGAGEDRDQFVVPADALGPLQEGILDERLFDITDLVADGFADTGALPVIVRDEPGEFDTMAATGSLWDRVTADRVDRVWLDGRARFTLAESVPQIGAPTAWESGYTGEGVTVAIIDGGYDPTHPDLAGRVKAAKDFSGESPEAIDGYGHGTHVASTVAGTGAASNGKYKGVAPDADLLVAKVCLDEGVCEESAIIAGLEWAAENGASVANVSLGSGPTDGTDPLSLAVNEITERTGMLIVVAAGNDGCEGCVSSPGTAEAALTVGSVTKQDTLSEFSSQGPRFGDGAVKPDIAGPGSSITAARAAGTSMGEPAEDGYTTADGTSMATPHVVGAAALLKQAHPDWTAARLKAALMGSSKGLEGLSVFEQGAGRVDVTDLSAPITADGSVSFGTFTYPYTEDPAAQNVTYTNDTDTAVELTLTVTGDPQFTVDSPKVTVPAHGTAAVAVSAKIAGGTVGNYGAHLTATADGVSVRTALGVVLEPELYDLNVDVTTRNGGPVVEEEWGTFVIVYGFAAESFDVVAIDAEGKGSIRLAPGRYQISGSVKEAGDSPSMTSFAEEVTIAGGDATSTPDLRAGQLVDENLDADDAVLFGTMNEVQAVDADGQHVYAFNQLASNGSETYSIPTSGLSTGFNVLHAVTYGSPKGAANAYSYSLNFSVEGELPGRTTFTVGNAELARDNAVYHSQGVAYSGARVDYLVDKDFFSIEAPAAQVPGRRTEYFTPGDYLGTVRIGEAASRYEFIEYDSVKTAGGRKDVVWGQAPLGVGMHSNSRLDDEIYFGPEMYEDTGADTLVTDHKSGNVTATAALTLNGEKVPLETLTPCWQAATLPAGASGTLVFSCDTKRVNEYSVLGTASSAKWTMQTAPGAPGENQVLPMVNVRLGSACVVNGYAPAGKRQDLTLDVVRSDTTAPLGTKKLTFEVSYDDGKTWKTVTVKRTGDHAVASMWHPKGAKFVSTRITAVDADGNAVTQSTTRSWALR